MAAIEFTGFTPDEIIALKQSLRPQLRQLGFERHVVWIESQHKGFAIDLNGKPISLIRVYTRCANRGQQVRNLFPKHYTIRVIAIGISGIDGQIYDFSRGG